MLQLHRAEIQAGRFPTAENNRSNFDKEEKMICLPDKPVSMTEWTVIRRVDVEKVCAVKSSPQDDSVIERSIEVHERNMLKSKHESGHGHNQKGNRLRRHSSYEPSLDDIKEEGHDSESLGKDLASIHRERALNSGAFHRNYEARHFRRKQHHKNQDFPRRARSYTC
ncbi:predicted protein [Nematostella vectensis]|uniref:Uncharacterized protein n=1 Tax=Nematostella vectensis TaxID=45351 RepID=A7SGW5_NEMVE|nr:predicted protein [Nematostella vectensis]|eukprot:XP_001629143.1 predicted protein [Nematostella vectensis]